MVVLWKVLKVRFEGSRGINEGGEEKKGHSGQREQHAKACGERRQGTFEGLKGESWSNQRERERGWERRLERGWV